MTVVHKILVATDFSPCSHPALDYAASLAAELGAALLVLHVFAIPALPTTDGTYVPAADEARLRAELDAGLAGLRRHAATLGARAVESALAEGEAWRQIVRVATERRCDLVVMGSHGRSGVAHFLLGSVAEKVLRKATCPVLIVKSAAATAGAAHESKPPGAAGEIL